MSQRLKKLNFYTRLQTLLHTTLLNAVGNGQLAVLQIRTVA